MPKHLWNRVLKNPSNTNVKNLVYKAIKNGKWTLKKSGSVEINYKYKKEIITVTGNVLNKIFKVGNAWVKR